MLKNILISSLLGLSPIISQNNFNIINNINKKPKLNDSSWTDYDLSKLEFNTVNDNKHNVANFNPDLYADHDFYISYQDIISSKPEGSTVQEDTFIELSSILDNKLNSTEQKVFGKTNIFATEARTDVEFNLDMYFYILAKDSKSTEDLNNPANSFKSLKTFVEGETASFYVRVSNNISSDWSTNKSYLDFTVNIYDAGNDSAEYTDNITRPWIVSHWHPNELPSELVWNWTKPTCEFEWDKYARTWDDFITIFKRVSIDLPDNSYSAYVSGEEHAFFRQTLDTNTIEDATWTHNPSKTVSTFYINWDDHWAGYHAHAEYYLNISHDSRFIYLRDYAYLGLWAAQSGIGVKTNIKELAFYRS